MITETNVPHADNIAYFGGGHEAHMIYQFTLPRSSCMLLTGHAHPLTAWAGSSLRRLRRAPLLLNFLASHDGLGLIPAVGWLAEADMTGPLVKAQACGGVSYRAVSGGGSRPTNSMPTSSTSWPGRTP